MFRFFMVGVVGIVVGTLFATTFARSVRDACTTRTAELSYGRRLPHTVQRY